LPPPERRRARLDDRGRHARPDAYSPATARVKQARKLAAAGVRGAPVVVDPDMSNATAIPVALLRCGYDVTIEQLDVRGTYKRRTDCVIAE